MFRKSNIMNVDKQDLSNYIEGEDVYNSRLIDLLKDCSRIPYEIRTFEYRPDLIAKDIYGDEKYMGFLLMSSAINLSQYKKGTIIEIIPKSEFENAINSL